MKRILIAILLVVFCAGCLYAAITTERPTKVIHKTNTNYETQTAQEIHRVVMGYARKNASPNFYSNDWEDQGFYHNNTAYAALGEDAVNYIGRTQFYAMLTQPEKVYLQSITGLLANVQYYVDITGQVVSTAPFEDYTETETSTSTTTTYENLDPYLVLMTDVYTVLTVNNDVVYQVIAQIYDQSPLVLDLNTDSTIDTAKNQWLPHAPKFYKEYARFFDMDGDGTPVFTEWTAPGLRDGLLVMPENGKVDSALQLFGTAGGYRDGFEKLSIICDKDKNGWVEGSELEGLSIWIDSNENATCESSELHPLSDYGISRLSTGNKDYVGRYATNDNGEHTMWDWWPAAMEVRKFRK